MSQIDFVDDTIVERGYLYYKHHRVTNISHVDKAHYRGTVLGQGRSYQVEISLENLEESTCECPYAQQHSVCKHMVCLFYQAFPEEVRARAFKKGGEEFAEVAERMLRGETFDEIYRTMGTTKKLVNDVRHTLGFPCLAEHGWKWPQYRIERELFALARNYSYRRDAKFDGFEETFNYIVYSDGKPALAIVHLGQEIMEYKGIIFADKQQYVQTVANLQRKEAICASIGVPLLHVNIREVLLGGYAFDSGTLRKALHDKQYAEQYNRRCEENFAEALYECALNSEDKITNATVCGCLNCEAIFSPQKVRIGQSGELKCPKCHQYGVITDKQGFTITKEFLYRAKKAMDLWDKEEYNNDCEDEDQY